MSRILFILVLLVVGFLLLRSWQRRKILTKRQGPGLLKKNVRMVRCEHCGLHVPETTAVTNEGRFFCSLDHAQQQASITRKHQDKH